MKSGMICAPENMLNHICYEIGVRELIADGYLCPLVTKASRDKIDTSALHLRAGEFISSETEKLMNSDELVESACREIISYCSDRKACLIFSAGVEHGEHIATVLRKNYHVNVGTVFGDTLPFERDQTLDDFKTGKLKYLVNVNVLTTGFDAPNIDCVAMVRPTMSPGLYYQMVGRGFRVHPDKENCLVLDFGGNVLRHGPVDAIEITESGSSGRGTAPVKECPHCRSLIAAGYSLCPDCGFRFPEPERNRHEGVAATEGILTGQESVAEYRVLDISYSVHQKRGADDSAPKSMRVEYQIGWQSFHSEWICFEHSGFARRKAEEWWWTRTDAEIPDTAVEAVTLAEAGALCKTKSITIKSIAGEKFDRIVDYELTDKPEWREPGSDDEPGFISAANSDYEDVPF
jgi:DNA repair protein RadD